MKDDLCKFEALLTTVIDKAKQERKAAQQQRVLKIPAEDVNREHVRELMPHERWIRLRGGARARNQKRTRKANIHYERMREEGDIQIWNVFNQLRSPSSPWKNRLFRKDIVWTYVRLKESGIYALEAPVVRLTLRQLEETTLDDGLPVEIRRLARKVLQALFNLMLPETPTETGPCEPTMGGVQYRAKEGFAAKYDAVYATVKDVWMRYPNSRHVRLQALQAEFPGIPPRVLKRSTPSDVAEAIAALHHGISRSNLQKARALAGEEAAPLAQEGETLSPTERRAPIDMHNPLNNPDAPLPE